MPASLHVGLAGRSQAAYRGAILQPQAPGFSRGVLTNQWATQVLHETVSVKAGFTRASQQVDALETQAAAAASSTPAAK